MILAVFSEKNRFHYPAPCLVHSSNTMRHWERGGVVTYLSRAHLGLSSIHKLIPTYSALHNALSILSSVTCDFCLLFWLINYYLSLARDFKVLKIRTCTIQD